MDLYWQRLLYGANNEHRWNWRYCSGGQCWITYFRRVHGAPVMLLTQLCVSKRWSDGAPYCISRCCVCIVASCWVILLCMLSNFPDSFRHHLRLPIARFFDELLHRAINKVGSWKDGDSNPKGKSLNMWRQRRWLWGSWTYCFVLSSRYCYVF